MSSTFGDLEPMNQLCRRWVRQAWDWPEGTAHPLYRLQRQAEGAGEPGFKPPMADDVLALGRVLAPERAAGSSHWKLIVEIYVMNRAPESVAKGRGVSRSTFYSDWKITLAMLTGGMKAAGFEVRFGEFRRSLDRGRLSA